MKRLAMCVLSATAALTFGLSLPHKAEARMQYFNAFKETYSKELGEDKINEHKCGICHGGEKGANKKKLSKFATELKEALGEKNVKDADKISAAFKTAAAKDAGDGKTYGDLLKDGQFPPPAEE